MQLRRRGRSPLRGWRTHRPGGAAPRSPCSSSTLRTSARWWIGEPAHHDVERAERRDGAARSWSSTSTRGSSRNRSRARPSIAGDESTATAASTPGRASSTNAVRRPSPHPRSRIRSRRRGQELDQRRFARQPRREPAHSTHVLLDLRRIAPRHRESLTLEVSRRRAGGDGRPVVSRRERPGSRPTSPLRPRSRATPRTGRPPRRSGRGRRRATRRGRAAAAPRP